MKFMIINAKIIVIDHEEIFNHIFIHLNYTICTKNTAKIKYTLRLLFQ